MTQRIQWQAVRAVVGSLAVIAAGCGQSEHSPVGPTEGFPGTIAIAPAGAIVGTSVILENRLASNPTGGSLSYSWDFGDGYTAMGGDSITHVYASEGTYVATVTVSSSEAGSAQASLNVPVRSVTARWSGDYGRVSITQDGLDLRGKVPGRSARGHRRGKSQRDGYGDLHRHAPGPRPGHVHGNGGPGRHDARRRREGVRRRQQALDAHPQQLAARYCQSMKMAAKTSVGRLAPASRLSGRMPPSKQGDRIDWPAGFGAFAITVRPPPATAPATIA